MADAAVVHRSAAMTPEQRGREFGVARHEAVDNTLAAYRRLFAATRGLDAAAVVAAGVQVRARVEHDWPALAAEVEAMAAGAEVDAAELFAANARTEILAGHLHGECSTLASVGAARPLLMQNWDWHPDLARSRVVWVVELPEGGWFATLTEAGLLAKIGLNSHGLAVCLNLLATSGDGDLEVLPVHLALRLILAGCKSVDDARSLLASAPFGASSCITVMDADGNVAMFECRPGGPPLEPPVQDRWATHTNHFLAPLPESLTDILRADWPDTDHRLGRVRAALADPATGPEVSDVLRDHGGGAISVCCHDEGNPSWADRQATLASLRMWPRERELEIAWGQPCACSYERIALPSRA
jgi:isopenicillin-N N-acyltransferase-like protein